MSTLQVSSHVVTEGCLPLNTLPISLKTLAKDRQLTISKADNGDLVVDPGQARIISHIDGQDGTLFILDSVLTFDE